MKPVLDLRAKRATRLGRSVVIALLAVALMSNRATADERTPVIASPLPATIASYTIPTENSGALYIAQGRRGVLWFTEFISGKIGMVDPVGRVREFAVPTPNSGPSDISLGPDGKMWFTEYLTRKIGRIDDSGRIVEYSLPEGSGQPVGITRGPDRMIWFSEWSANLTGSLNRISEDGAVDQVDDVQLQCPAALPFLARDSTIWFSESSSNRIAGVLSDGTSLEIAPPLPAPDGMSCLEMRGKATLDTAVEPIALSRVAETIGGDIWFPTYSGVDRFFIARLKQDRRVTYVRLDRGSAASMASDRKYTIWFVNERYGHVESIDTGLRLRDYTRYGAGGPAGLCVTEDGAVWFVERAANKIGRIRLKPR